MIRSKQIATSLLFFPLLVAFVSSLAVVVEASTPYHIQSTSYTLTSQTTYQIKKENCHSNFGNDAWVLDMKTAKSDFDNSPTDFNYALATVFFQHPNSIFYVAYGGTDVVPVDQNSNAEVVDGMKYILRSHGTASYDTIDTFGRARVETSNHVAHVLCAVPIIEIEEEEAASSLKGAARGYVPADEDNTKQNRFSLSRLSLLMAFMAVGVVVHRHRTANSGSGSININNCSMPTGGTTTYTNSPSLMLSQAYYSVLDGSIMNTNASGIGSNARGSNDNNAGLSAHLTEGCELSYNPAVQGLV